jgi:valyl-tRNA synthetase
VIHDDQETADVDYVDIDTTRPETIFGDVAVAIHPEDHRYRHLHGKAVRHPFTHARLPILLDAILVDPAKGTGVVKVSPAHDLHDFACAARHQLRDDITGIDVAGRVTLDHVRSEHRLSPSIKALAGLHRFHARVQMIAWLKAQGLYRGKVYTLDICFLARVL